jgi:membrane protease subunit HflC
MIRIWSTVAGLALNPQSFSSLNPNNRMSTTLSINISIFAASRRSGQAKSGLILVAALVAAILLMASIYTVDEAEQAIVVQFGAPVGEPVTEPGLHFRVPFIQEIRRFDKRLLSWDGDPNQIPTVEEQFISVDTTARWRIVDPLKYLQSVQNEFGAQSRLNDILDSVVRDKIASSSLVDIVRSKNWQVSKEDLQRAMAAESDEDILMQKVETGREELVRAILETAQKQMPQYGIELVDIRIKRINYVEMVQQQVFERMIAERQRIAEQFRSEGQGRSAEIDGETDRLLLEIKSGAERDADVIRGMADAEATKIYNDAYGADPEFYAFYRTLESYSKSLGRGTTMFLGADSDYFKYFQSSVSRQTPAMLSPKTVSSETGEVEVTKPAQVVQDSVDEVGSQ